MSLTVLSVAYPLAPVGPDAVGGSEQILHALDRALVAAGHRSIVVAMEGSEVADTLVPVPKRPGPLSNAVREATWPAHKEAIAAALQRWPIDLIHMHAFDFHAYLPAAGGVIPGMCHALFSIHRRTLPPPAREPSRPPLRTVVRDPH